MKYCEKCGKEIGDDVLFCPSCGEKVVDLEDAEIVSETKEIKPKEVSKKDNSTTCLVLGILSIIFGLSGGMLGVVLGIIGICIDPKGKYKSLNIIGLVLSIVISILTIVFAILIAIGVLFAIGEGVPPQGNLYIINL